MARIGLLTHETHALAMTFFGGVFSAKFVGVFVCLASMASPKAQIVIANLNFGCTTFRLIF